jgi:serine/threonine protein kinase
VGQVESIQGMLEVAAGAKAIHNLGVVHCDLKPGNIMRAGDGTFKVSPHPHSPAARIPTRLLRVACPDNSPTCRRIAATMASGCAARRMPRQ